MIKFYVFLIFSCSLFFYGIAAGHYEIFPFDFIQSSKSLILNNFEKDQNNILIYENDIDSLIKINYENDIIDKRKNLTNFIWKNTVPYSSSISIDKNIQDDHYQNFNNLKSIHRLSIDMEYEINSTAYLFLPEVSNNKLIIYHEGHAGDFIAGKNTIIFLLDEGYSVLAMSMPLLGMNNNPIIDLDNFGKIKFTTHKQLRFLESSEFSPIKFFIEPIGVSLNYLDEYFDFDSYYMVGISGGGWTTVLFSAIDDRISQSYSVAGTFPIFMRSDTKNVGDYEQIVPELYSIANYLELYIMGSYGSERKLVLIYNEFDPCCFPGELYEKYPYLEVVSQKLNLLGNGEFDVIIDKSSNKHEISNVILDQILDELNS